MKDKYSSAKRPGPKSSAQTPAKKSERKKGSSKNKPGSAGQKGGKINFSAKVLESLKNKVKEHNSKYSKKVTLSQLKKVYRRGAGAFSSSHRPGKSRGQWAMARVNTFLKMVRGGKVKDSYRKADQDIAKASANVIIDDGIREENFLTEEDFIQAKLDIYNDQLQEDPDFTEEMWSEIFSDVDELGFEEYVDEESWAAEANKGKKLNKPFRTPGGPKKFSVYVKNEKGNVVKVNFGDPNMEIKRDDPNRRKNFRARHNCENPGPKTKARYWSCKMWAKKSVTKMTKGEDHKETEESEASSMDYMEKAFMHHCAKYDDDLVNTAGMDKDKTYAACAIQYKKMKSSLYEKSKAGLTEKQKKLPKPLQEAILKKQGEEMKESESGHHEKDKDKKKKKKSYSSLWENIRKKKKRMGKNYRPAKPGDKDRPTKEALKRAQGNPDPMKHYFETKEEALKDAKKLGLEGFHTLKDKNGKTLYMAGPSHKAFMEKHKEVLKKK